MAHARGKISDNRVTYILRNGMKLVLRTRSSDRHVFNDIWLQHVYDQPDIQWERFQTIVDIGAHAGYFSCYAASRSPSAHIIAFEPEPSNIEIFQANVDINQLQNRVKLEHAGVSGQNGTLRLHVTPGREESHSAHRQGENSVPMDVPVVSLDHALTAHHITHCDLMKINCEGEEYELLYALPVHWFAQIDTMLINYHLFSPNPQHHPNHLISFLEKQGYTVTKHPNEILYVRRAKV
jgi:FkbM family methyltransferase